MNKALRGPRAAGPTTGLAYWMIAPSALAVPTETSTRWREMSDDAINDFDECPCGGHLYVRQALDDPFTDYLRGDDTAVIVVHEHWCPLANRLTVDLYPPKDDRGFSLALLPIIEPPSLN